MNVLITGSRTLAQLGQSRYLRDMPTLAVYYLAGILRDEGHNVRVIDPYGYEFDNMPALIAEALYQNQSLAHISDLSRICLEVLGAMKLFPLRQSLEGIDIVAISSTSYGWFLARRIIQEVKSYNPEIFVVVGGPHATYVPDYVIESTPIDFLIRGEGEESLPKLLKAIEKKVPFSEVEGLSYKTPQGVVHNSLAPKIPKEKLEQVADPAFDLLPDHLYNAIGIETSRGCHFSCQFCSSMYKGSFRGLKPEVVIRRIEHAAKYHHKLIQHQPGQTIGLIDDSFAMDVMRAAQILEEIEEIDIENFGFFIEARASDILHPRVTKALAKSPVVGIQIGVECGYDRGLRRVGKGVDIATIEECAARLHEYGLHRKTLFSFIVGLPWEKKEDCFKTLDYMLHISSTYAIDCLASWLRIYPGNPLWDRRIRYGFSWGPEIFDDLTNRCPDLAEKIAYLLTKDDIDEIKERFKMMAELKLLIDGDPDFGRVSFISA